MKTKQNYLKEFKIFQNLISAVRGRVGYNLVVIVIVMIANFKIHAQCEPENGCFNNLIPNHGFEFSCQTPSPNGSPYWNAFEVGSGCVKNWRKSEGSPHIIVSPFVSVNPATTGGDFYTCLQAIYNCNNNYCYREGIHVPLNSNLKFIKDQNYNLRFLARSASITDDVTIGPASEPINYTMLLANTYTPDYDNCSEQFGQKQIISANQINEADWKSFSECSFVPDDDYDFFAIRVDNFPVRNNVVLNSLFLVDNVEVWCESILDVGTNYSHVSGNTYDFTGSYTAMDGLVVEKWYWDFGDGTFSTEQNPTHTFNQGTFKKVCLCITDTRGCTRQLCIVTENNCNCTTFNEILSDITISNDITIDEHMVITPGVKVTFNGAHARFLGGCKILVQRNARLNVITSTLEQGECEGTETPWGGIQVWGTWDQPHPSLSDVNANNNYLDPYQGIVFVNAGSYLIDVYNPEYDGAISAGPNPPFIDYMDGPLSSTWSSYFGGVIVSQGSVISNCRKGISMQRYPAPGLNYLSTNYIYNTNFDECRFGITSSWNNGLSISNCVFTMANLSTIKSNIAMTLLNGRTTVTNSTVNKYAHGVDGIATENPLMNLYIGDPNNPNSHNTFNNCKLGVMLNWVTNTFIHSNEFTRTITNDEDAGIWADGRNGYDIWNNNFDGYLAGGVFNDTRFNDITFQRVFCNEYSDYSGAIISKGNNELLEFNNETFGAGNVAFYFDKSTSNVGKVNVQGATNSARYNFFNSSGYDIYTPSASFANTVDFTYYYPNGQAQGAALRPQCAINAVYCGTATGNYTEKSAYGGSFNCPVDIPGLCVSQFCLDSLNNVRTTLTNLISNGGSITLRDSVLNYTGQPSVISHLNYYSPYLSDSVLIALLNNTNFTESQKKNYLLAQARLNHGVSSLASTILSPSAYLSIDTLYGPSPLRLLEKNINDIDGHRWLAMRDTIGLLLNDTSYTNLLNLLDAQPDTLASQWVKLDCQKALAKWNDANATINYLSEVSDSMKMLLRTELRLDRYYDYHLDPTEISVLEDLEFVESKEGAKARSILSRIDIERQYYPVIPDAVEERSKFIGNKQTEFKTVSVVLVPNPTHDYFNIVTISNTPIIEPFDYEILEINGRRIESGKILESKNISTEKLSAGMYFVKINTKIETLVLKLIKY